LQMMYKDLTLRTIIVYAMPESAKQRAISDIDKALSDSALQHRIAETMSLDKIATANQVVEKGSIRGAVILTID
jgi:NADPH2:quinone reductase